MPFSVFLTKNAGPDQVICDGEIVTLSGSGAQTYIWDNGVTDGVAFVPTLGETMYTVVGTDANGCSNTDQVTITVNALPNVIANASQGVVCDGEMITLSGSGAQTYIWDNGITDGVPFTQPIGTNVYTVIGTDNMGCSNSDQVTVTVNSLPVVTAQASASELCYGASLTLTGSGANTYTWNDGITDGVPFVPSETKIYTVKGTDLNGCFSNSQIEAEVNKVDTSVTVNENTLTANAIQASYQWKDCGTNQSISGEINNSFTPTLTGTYAVEVTQNGCIDVSSCYEVIITGINENTFGSELVVYPNPVNELLTIDMGERYNEIFIRLLNIAGKEVINKSFKQQQHIELELNNVPDGLYFINIRSEDKNATIKVVKKK